MSQSSSLFERFLEPVADALTPAVAARIVAFRADAETQSRIDELADKCNEGQLTPAEHEQYTVYVTAIDLISVLQAKARAVLARSAS